MSEIEAQVLTPEEKKALKLERQKKKAAEKKAEQKAAQEAKAARQKAAEEAKAAKQARKAEAQKKAKQKAAQEAKAAKQKATKKANEDAAAEARRETARERERKRQAVFAKEKAEKIHRRLVKRVKHNRVGDIVYYKDQHVFVRGLDEDECYVLVGLVDDSIVNVELETESFTNPIPMPIPQAIIKKRNAFQYEQNQNE